MTQASATAGPHCAVAHVLLRHQAGVFVAEACEIDSGIVTATGRWRYAIGANYAEVRWGRAGTYSWPRDLIREVRWQAEDAS